MDSRNIFAEEQSFDLLDAITISSLILQIVDHNRHAKQIGNNEIMRELQRQSEKYLKKILENQKEIIKLLSEIKDTRLNG